MPIIFAILGTASILVSVTVFKDALTAPEHFYMTRFTGVPLALGGIALLVAAVKRYRGHWAFFVGLALIFGASLLIGIELDNYRADKSKSPEISVIVSVSLLTLGVLSLWSAHKLHTYEKAVEDRAGTRGC